VWLSWLIVDACPSTATETKSWGAIKGLYR
jgi:hypothetical protein